GRRRHAADPQAGPGAAAGSLPPPRRRAGQRHLRRRRSPRRRGRARRAHAQRRRRLGLLRRRRADRGLGRRRHRPRAARPARGPPGTAAVSGAGDDAFASHLALWRAQEPEMEFAEPFVPAPLRARFRAWGTLLAEIERSLLLPSDPNLALQRLAWWHEEL